MKLHFEPLLGRNGAIRVWYVRLFSTHTHSFLFVDDANSTIWTIDGLMKLRFEPLLGRVSAFLQRFHSCYTFVVYVFLFSCSYLAIYRICRQSIKMAITKGIMSFIDKITVPRCDGCMHVSLSLPLFCNAFIVVRFRILCFCMNKQQAMQ